jgi:hypothetical protein
MKPSYEITIDPPRGLLRITVSGFLSFDDLTGILVEKERALARLGLRPNRHLTLCDFSSCKLQSQDVVQLCRAAIADPRYMARRIVFVIGSSLARMQLRRMLERDDAKFFETMEAAEAWLFDVARQDARVAAG